MDDFKVNHENNVKDVRSVKSSISKVANDLADNTLELRNEIKTVVNNAKQENENLQSTVIDLQCRSMKNNLVFTGLTETEGENTEEVIRDFIQQFLHVTHRIEFGNIPDLDMVPNQVDADALDRLWPDFCITKIWHDRLQIRTGLKENRLVLINSVLT
ncbi:unnamed protein product [Mytilus edulis]|uniref:Uncharacterized protein n=1 Tax=Mytilus edulis TaxID=6550 RepID=A0A8S3PX99_MYTED|nr:unnamed protein product [Mytilus edulis]